MYSAFVQRLSKLNRKTINRILVACILLIGLVPAFALAGSVTLPPAATIHDLGAPPINHSAELFEGAPSYNTQILTVDRYFNAYSVNLNANVAYSFVVSDFEFDLLFLITDSAGNILADSTTAHAAANGIELRLIAPAAGTYRILISSVAGTETGDYTISVNAIPGFAEISGLVENGTGQALEEILVTAYRQVNTPEGIQYIAELSTESLTDGTFTLSPLVPGDYKVSFRDLNFRYGHLYYHQEPTFEDANIVTVSSGANLTLSTTVLTRAGAITGNVTDAGGANLEGILVSAYIEYVEYVGSGQYEESIFSIFGTETDASGNFALTGLENDTYFVQFTCPDGLFLTQYYAGAGTIGSASAIIIAQENIREDTDAVMQDAATISGTTTNSINEPVEDIVVSLLQLQNSAASPQSFDCFEIVDQAVTCEDGIYFFGALVAGTYFLHFSDLEDRFLEMYYEDAFTPARADSFVLADTQHLTGKNVVLTPNSSIAGTVEDTAVNPLSGIVVRLFNMADAPNPITQEFLENYCHETFTDDFGTYYLAAIAPGTYLLQFIDLSGEHSTVFHFGHFSPDTANHIVIAAGTHLIGVDAMMTPASTITGTIGEAATDLPLYPAQVFLFESATNLNPVHTTNTQPNGNFSLSPLDAGTYYLGFIKSGYAVPDRVQFYDNVFDISNATAITLGERDQIELEDLRWQPLPLVTLTLDAQNNTPPQVQTHPVGTVLDTLPTPTRTGYSFAGWSVFPSGGNLVELPFTLDANITFYAQWNPREFTIAFDSQGGSAVPDADFSFNETLGTLPVSVRENYNFAGWFDRPAGGIRKDSTTPVTRSMTLYAQWDIDTHGVTFNSRGGSYVSDIRTDFGQDIGALPTPYRSYHIFLGWFTSPTDGSRVRDNHIITSDTTLYAQWRAQRVNVAFDTRGGRSINPQSREVGTRLGTLPTPTHPDRTFHRWTLDSAGTNPVNSNTRVRGNMTLYAQWRGDDSGIRMLLQNNPSVFRSLWR